MALTLLKLIIVSKIFKIMKKIIIIKTKIIQKKRRKGGTNIAKFTKIVTL